MIPSVAARVCALAVVTGCAQSSAALDGHADGWPEADALFHRDPRWLGADGAYSIPLGGERTLWLFGDTFVATSAANVRGESRLVRNSVAVQTGLDPTKASIAFHWRTEGGRPASFFAEDGDGWFWPMHGIRLDRALVVFLSRVHATPGRGLGFEADGWRLAVIDDADADPATWQPRLVTPPAGPAGILAGQSVLLADDQVVVLAVREPGDHAGFLVRYRRAELAAGRVEQAEWWAGDRGWLPADALGGQQPTVVLTDAGPECSLHFDPGRKQFIHVKSLGFGATTIAVSFAASVQGPWSAPRSIFRPPESDRPKAFVYAGKAHPELSGDGALVVTYAANTLGDFATLVADTSLYFPRFVRLSLGKGANR
jgi:hypothetical protein